MSVKNRQKIVYANKIILEILAYLLVKVIRALRLVNIKKIAIASLIDDSVRICDKIMDVQENVLIDSINKKSTYKMDYVFHTFFISNHILVIVNNDCL